MSNAVSTKLQRHPAGLYILFFTAMWEYFSYYGMRALLVLYMTKSFMFSDDHAYTVYGGYGALVYITPLIGTLIADHVFGYRVAIIIGAVLMIVGHVVLAMSGQHLFFLALAIIICGNGFTKPNLVNMLGQLYEHGDDRRDSGFTLFYVGANIGPFLSPIICGYVAVTYGWNWGFIVAGLGMVLGLIGFIVGQPYLKSCRYSLNQHQKSANFSLKPVVGFGILILIPLIAWVLKNSFAGTLMNLIGLALLIWLIRSAIKDGHGKGLIAMFILIIFGMIFWAFDQQAGSSITLFTDRMVDRHVGSMVIPTASFQSVNPAVILIFGPIIALLWTKLSVVGIKFSAFIKIAFALILVGLGFFVLSFAAHLDIHGGKQSYLWVILAYLLMTIGELCCEPVGLAAANTLPPKKLIGIMIASWYLYTGAYANYVAMYIAKFASVAPKVLSQASQHVAEGVIYQGVFSKVAIIACVAGLVLMFINFGMRNKVNLDDAH